LASSVCIFASLRRTSCSSLRTLVSRMSFVSFSSAIVESFSSRRPAGSSPAAGVEGPACAQAKGLLVLFSEWPRSEFGGADGSERSHDGAQA
jgi:hypothetical protein